LREERRVYISVLYFHSYEKGLALAGIGILALIILSAGIIAFIIDPESMLALETQAGQEAYRLTGGYLGTPPPPPPPVKMNVGEEVLFNGITGIT